MGTDRDSRRIERLQAERISLENDYREALVAALQDCAAGRLGLFGRNAGLLPWSLEQRVTPDSVRTLERIGEELEQTRAALGYAETFAPIRMLQEARETSDANARGEVRQAKALLDAILKDA